MLDGQLQWPQLPSVAWVASDQKKFTFICSLSVTHHMPLFLKWVSYRCSKLKSFFFIPFDNVCILIGMYRLIIFNAIIDKARLKNTIIDKARLKYHLDRCFLIYLFALCSFFFCCCYFFVNKILNIVLGLIMYILKE